MKTQIKFQKYLSLATLIIGALVFVFALCFFSGNLGDILFYKNRNLEGGYGSDFMGAEDFISSGQSFVSILLIFGIIYICAAAFLYITATNSRRNYYITNYVAIGIVAAVCAAVTLLLLIDLSLLIVKWNNVDWDGIELLRTATRDGELRLKDAPEVSQNMAVFIIGYVLMIIVIANIVAWALNLVWKLKLMKGEKALLENGLVKEVA